VPARPLQQCAAARRACIGVMRRYRVSMIRFLLRLQLVAVLLTGASFAAAANPLSLIGETYATWKERLFGAGHPTPEPIDAPASGTIALEPGHPVRIRIAGDTPQRALGKSSSHYREIELPAALAHASVRVQVVAEDNPRGRGNAVFKPVLYALDEGGDVKGAPIEIKPLHLDMRPFRRTRLLGCVRADDLQHFVLTAAADANSSSYESDVRDAVKAPTPNGFYYATDAVKVKLPYADTGTLILDVGAEDGPGKGC
jgi:hypothetical protein